MNKYFATTIVLAVAVSFSAGWYFSLQYYSSNHLKTAFIKNKIEEAPKAENQKVLASNYASAASENKLTDSGNEETLLGTSLQSDQNEVDKELRKEMREILIKYFTLQSEFEKAQALLEAQGKEFLIVSESLAKKYLPEPFATATTNKSGLIAENFETLHSNSDYLESDIVLQERISDFLITHDLGHLVTLESVKCRKDICEMFGFQQEHG